MGSLPSGATCCPRRGSAVWWLGFLGAHKEKASSEATRKEEATLKPHKKRGRCLPPLLVLEELQADRLVKESKSSRALQVK